MPKNLNRVSLLDPRITSFEFIDDSAEDEFAIQIITVNEGESDEIKAKVGSLISTLRMSEYFPDFLLIDQEEKTHIRIGGNISEAMHWIKKEDNSLKLFSSKLFEAIDKDEEVQQILEACKICYEKPIIPKKREYGAPLSKKNIFKSGRSGKEESKEDDESNPLVSTSSQSIVKNN